MADERGSVRFFCTAGGGMEPFLMNELKHKLDVTEVEHIPGRVFFRCHSGLIAVKRLKSAERLFLLLLKAPPTFLPTNPAKATGIIQQSIVGAPDLWNCALCTWTELQSELKSSGVRGQKRKREEESDEKTRYDERKLSGPKRPTFRVSCRCSGTVARRYNSQNLNRIIGVAITNQLGWKADLREPTLEINVYLSDDYCIVGIPLLRHSLASRSYLKHTGLRSTVAWAMASLCDIQESSVILDPMCGVGTILLEAALECPNGVFIGMDSEKDQLQKAAENVEAAGQESKVSLVHSSCLRIPLPSGSVDAVVCDVPFGRKFSCGTDMTTALPHILSEMERVLRVDGCLVLLLSLQLSAQIKKLITHTVKTQPSKSDQHNPHEHTQTLKTQTSEPDQQNCHVETHTLNPQHRHNTEQQCFCSLVQQSKHRVSLGSTDALIHTYTKILTERHTPNNM